MADTKTNNKKQSTKTAENNTANKSYSKEQYFEWLESMLVMRRFEEKAGQLYGQQKIRGFCHLYIGQEACAAGSVSALNKDDKFITAYRDHGLPLALGTEPKYVMAELFARTTGTTKGKGGSMHIFDRSRNAMGGYGIVGGQIPLGAGVAFAEQFFNTKNVSICFMGDGAVRQGSFHETMNMSMLWKLPVIFCIENNGYAMGTSVERSSNVTDLHYLGESYRMPHFSVNGMRVEDVHQAVGEAAERARAGNGPTLLELRTYRYKGHSMSDPAKYRTKEELEEYKSVDPTEQCKKTIVDKKFATEEEAEQIDEKVKQRIQEAVEFAEQSPHPDPKGAYEDVYVQADYPFTTD